MNRGEANIEDKNRERSAERLQKALLYEEKGIGKIWRQEDNIYGRTEKYGLYLVPNQVIIAMDNVSRAVNCRTETLSGINLTVHSVDLLTERTMGRLTVLLG